MAPIVVVSARDAHPTRPLTGQPAPAVRSAVGFDLSQTSIGPLRA
ncbi:hypothetical protein [Nocardia concava]|nr:hypothetical protein [Nocardia concava]